MAIRERPLHQQRILDVSAGRLAAIVGTWHEPAILEGCAGFGEAGRWSIYAAFPRAVFEATGDSARTDVARDAVIPLRNGPFHVRGVDPLATLARFAEDLRLANPDEQPDPDAAPFQGGLIGFLGYDLAPWIERLPRRMPRDSRMPDIRMGLYDTAVIHDRLNDSVTLHAWDLLGLGQRDVERRLSRWTARIEGERLMREGRIVAGRPLSPTSAFDRRSYGETVRRVLDYIAAGDIFQVNLSQRFETRGEIDALNTYLRLRRLSPAPFSAFLRWGDMAVVSASPEWFYQTRGPRIVTRPIKGTRRRGASPREDDRLAAALAESPKDRAELTMIVDLERNDLGRVSQYGSVVVEEALQVETFPQVHHLVATISGVLRPGIGPIDVVRAMFPGGSITGAPKIRAMEIIDELEPNRRGLYTGAIGYLSRGGASAFNIAIRTILIEGDRASYQVGGGIVADSDPDAEYDETLAKGMALRAVLEGHGGDISR